MLNSGSNLFGFLGIYDGDDVESGNTLLFKLWRINRDNLPRNIIGAKNAFACREGGHKRTCLLFIEFKAKLATYDTDMVHRWHKYRFEPNALIANLLTVICLCPITYIADALNVIFVERLAVMHKDKLVLVRLDKNLKRIFACICKGIDGILKQLIYETFRLGINAN